jgi:hypothetical protein
VMAGAQVRRLLEPDELRIWAGTRVRRLLEPDELWIWAGVQVRRFLESDERWRRAVPGAGRSSCGCAGLRMASVLLEATREGSDVEGIGHGVGQLARRGRRSGVRRR